MLLEELIFEMSRASLYHFTPLDRALRILDSDRLDVSQNTHTAGTVSFTREPRYDIVDARTGDSDWEVPGVRFELDHDKLKFNHRIRPHRESEYIEEFEEISYGPITNLNKYLIEISVPDMETYERYLKQLYVSFFLVPDDKKHLFRRYDKAFSKPIPPNDMRIMADVLYNALVVTDKLAKHPRMKGNDAKELKRLFDVYENAFLEIDSFSESAGRTR